MRNQQFGNLIRDILYFQRGFMGVRLEYQILKPHTNIKIKNMIFIAVWHLIILNLAYHLIILNKLNPHIQPNWIICKSN